MKLTKTNNTMMQTSKAVALYRSLPIVSDGRPEITQMRGNPRARILLIAPPCTELEYKQNVPFADQAAQIFHDIVKEHSGLDTDAHTLVVSCSRFNVKPNKESTSYICEFLADCAKEKIFDFYISVGDDAFKFIFGRGKKPSMPSISGQVMYVEETDYVPLFVFPNVAPLAPEVDSLPDDDAGRRERYIRERLQNETIIKMNKVALKLKAALAKFKIKV